MAQEVGMFVEVKKITTGDKKSASDGSKIVNPQSGQAVKEQDPKVQVECIRVDEIRSFRRWHMSADHEAFFHGQEMTKIYMKGDKSKDSKPEMLILESCNSFAQRLKTIRLANGEEETEKH